MTASIPSLPVNIDPRIAEILRRRAEQGVTITRTPTPATMTAPRVPGAPIEVTRTTTVTPQEAPVGDAELADLLGQVLPRIDALVRRAITDLRSDGRLTLVEALALAPEVRLIVSQVIGELLPEIKGTSARELVILVLSVLVQQYVSPYLPALLRPYLTAQLLRTLIAGLETAYQRWVKPRLPRS
jgi:hypothetical protein